MSEPTSARAVLLSVADRLGEIPGTPPSKGASTGPDGPIGWEGYGAARQAARERTGETESVVCATGVVGATEAVLISFEFGFLGGSLGEETGDRIAAAFTVARTRRLPVVTLVATGGSRMQEGMRALSQLQRVSHQAALTREAGLPQLAVVRNPATGGGWATLAAAADITLALPGAQTAFAGSRVRPADADPHAYTAEGQYAAGQLDAIVPPEALKRTLERWLQLLTTPAEEPAPPPYPLGPGGLPETGWDAVVRARHEGRPRAGAYRDAHFAQYAEISGDRCGGIDDGVRCGFGQLPGGGTVAYAAQCGTPTTPAGYRTAARLIRLADRLHTPVLTLVDTPGADNGAEAERAGAGAAIADCFTAIATARVPVTTLLIGEGGSGGALALCSPENMWTTPSGYFSVIAPEMAAAILKRDQQQVHHTADQLRLRPQDLVDLGVARGVVPAEELP